MLRSALALLSSLQIGVRIRQSIERSLRQAVVIAIALLFLIAAAGFGLLAGYHALVMIYHFNAVEAAGIIAGALLLVGVLILATLPLFKRKPKPQPIGTLVATGSRLGFIDEGIAKAVRQVGPFSLVMMAFTAGFFASRR